MILIQIESTETMIMKIVMHVGIVLLLATPAVAQVQSNQTKEEKTKQEIQKLSAT